MTYEFRRDWNIGAADAGNDEEFLRNCFIDTGVKNQLTDLNSRKCILIGRVGSGKSAILNTIEREVPKCGRIDPENFSLIYLGRSNIIQILANLGLNIEPLLEALWQHVLCLEYIKTRYNLDSRKKYEIVWGKIKSTVVNDERKKAALNYFQSWSEKGFWETTEARVREISSSLEEQLSAKLETTLWDKVKSSLTSSQKLTEAEKLKLEDNLKTVIGSKHLNQLHKVMDVLSEDRAKNSFKDCYILIDDLDGRFLQNIANYTILSALIASIKKMRKIDNLKIVISIRTDVYESMLRVIKDPTYQKDKFGDFEIRQHWKDTELKALVDKRVNYLIKSKYKKEDVSFGDITSVGKGPSADSILEDIILRTTRRPREVILFINEAFQVASGGTTFNTTTIREAEKQYSIKRKESVAQEWQVFLPLAEKHLDIYRGFESVFQLGNLETDSIEDKCITYIDENPGVDDSVFAAACDFVIRKSKAAMELQLFDYR